MVAILSLKTLWFESDYGTAIAVLSGCTSSISSTDFDYMERLITQNSVQNIKKKITTQN